MHRIDADTASRDVGHLACGREPGSRNETNQFVIRELGTAGFHEPHVVRTREDGPPVFLSQNPWWGVGGMIDWSNTYGADFWHDLKRQPLVDMGVAGHWCDLGEPLPLQREPDEVQP